MTQLQAGSPAQVPLASASCRLRGARAEYREHQCSWHKYHEHKCSWHKHREHKCSWHKHHEHKCSWHKHQKGMSLTGALVLMSVAIFLGLFAFRVGPHYLEYWTIKKVAEQLAQNPEVMKQPKRQVNKFIDRGFSQNNLWGRKAEDTIHLEKDGKHGMVVRVAYENRVNLFSNIDVVTSFNTEVKPY